MDILLGLVLLVVFVVLIRVVLVEKDPAQLGIKGEYEVSSILHSLPQEYFVIDNVIIPDQHNKHTTQIDHKLRNYLFFLLGDEEYCWLPDEPMEKYLRSKGYTISRQTIANYRERLESLGYYHAGEFIYYRVETDENDKKYYTVVSRDEYNYAWHLYWDKRNNEDFSSKAAFSYMYSAFGGIPRKQAKPEQNAVYLKELNTLLDLVSSSIEKEVSNRC